MKADSLKRWPEDIALQGGSDGFSYTECENIFIAIVFFWHFKVFICVQDQGPAFVKRYFNRIRKKANKFRVHAWMQDWEDECAVELSSESKKIHTDNIFDFKSEISRQVVYDFVYVAFFDAEDFIGESYFFSW